ncbi:hypothetical protein Ddye_016695 [Dipteronia dyeriana]|uniref:RNase H type-1 domain-containing protein n=1 Tax=Dipteronia dyeriana TaxID=168575 RepID=A0AAD9U7V3_9ROSI|nr:hypothetical protein Ddye_016695 [Dipteronia dyeriana]
MSMFNIPTGLYNDPNEMISKFWWGSRDGKRKVSWISWKNMCVPKRFGGLGFKELFLFNQAPMAKQAWRTMSFLDSLAARVLKAKYFKPIDFLSTLIKLGYSHIWRSLTWGREFLSKNLRWSVGDSSSLRVFRDKWISHPCSFKPVSFDPGQNSGFRFQLLCDGKVALGWQFGIPKGNCSQLVILLAGYFSVEVGHFLALPEGLLFAKSLNFPISIAECSSIRVASSLSGHGPFF